MRENREREEWEGGRPLCVIHIMYATYVPDVASVHLFRANLVKSACVNDRMFLPPITKVGLLRIYLIVAARDRRTF